VRPACGAPAVSSAGRSRTGAAAEGCSPASAEASQGPYISLLSFTEISAEQGDARAQYEYGSNLYLDSSRGELYPYCRDPIKEAVEWLEKAGEQVHLEAQWLSVQEGPDSSGLDDDSGCAGRRDAICPPIESSQAPGAVLLEPAFPGLG
jgi:TPR repeat protein